VNPLRGQSDPEESEFLDGVIWVAEGDRRGVPKNGDYLLERDAMLLRVGGGLLVVPLDDHRASLYALVSGLANTALSCGAGARVRSRPPSNPLPAGRPQGAGSFGALLHGSPKVLQE
jgi:hypothetical protein